MRILIGVSAAILLTSGAMGFEFSSTAGSNGYKMTFSGKCANKDCSTGTIRAWQACKPATDSNCPVNGSGSFTRKGNCYNINYVWVMKDGARYPRQHYWTADGGICSF